MKTTLKTARIVGALAFAALIGCGPGMTGSSSSGKATSTGNTDTSQAAALADIDAEVKSIQELVDQSQTALDQLAAGGFLQVPQIPALGGSGASSVPNSPSPGLPSFGSGSTNPADILQLIMGLLSGGGGPLSDIMGIFNAIPDALKKLCDALYDKLTESVGKAQSMISQAQAQIAAQMAKLDPSDPRQAEMISKLQLALDKLAGYQAKVSGVYQLLADKVGMGVTALDKVIAGLQSSGNVGAMIGAMQLSQIRTVLADFATRLANTH
jgi:hypothetical protein